MSAPYQHLALADVKPGMMLSDELLDRQGQVLLPKGAILTANTIALLPGHGIDMLAVLCSADDASAKNQPDQDAIEQRLGKVFRKIDPDNDDDVASATLRHFILDYRLEREIDP